MVPISQVITGASALSGLLNSWKSSTEPATASSAAAAEPRPAPPEGTTAALRRLAAQYDVTQITPRQYSRLLDGLHKTGALTEAELNQLGQVLLDLEQEGIEMDEELDLLKFYTDRLDKLQDRLDDLGADAEAFQAIAPSLSSIQKRLDWISRLALLHAAPDGAGVNVLT